MMTLMGPATAPPALSSAALFTALAARARSSDASLAGEAGVFTFWAAAAGADAFLAGAAAFLAGAEADLGTAAFLDGEAAATALATPAAAAVRLEAGRDDDLEGGGGAPRFSDAELQAILDEIATWKSLD